MMTPWTHLSCPTVDHHCALCVNEVHRPKTKGFMSTPPSSRPSTSALCVHGRLSSLVTALHGVAEFVNTVQVVPDLFVAVDSGDRFARMLNRESRQQTSSQLVPLDFLRIRCVISALPVNSSKACTASDSVAVGCGLRLESLRSYHL